MGTRNFKYENRCIVLTDDDYEFGNHPKMGDHVGNNRDYPSREIEEDDMPEFHFWKPVITFGYYGDACIDYIRTECDAEYWLGNEAYYETKKDVIDECVNMFGLSRYRLNKILPKVYKTLPFYEWYGDAINALTEYLADLEEKKVNEYLDKLKERYGCEEIVLVSTASNGEGFYQKVS